MLERAHGLTSDQLLAIAALESRCREHDGGRLKLEWGSLNRRPTSYVNDLLWWDDDQLVGFVARYKFGGQQSEATGMVDPAHRNRGIGTALLEQLQRLCTEQGDEAFLLVTPRTCLTARRLAERHGGTFHHAEHAMVLTSLVGHGERDASITLRQAVPGDEADVGDLLSAGFGYQSGTVNLDDDAAPTVLAVRDGEVIATLRVALEHDSRGIYGFVVDPSVQGRGIGRDVLRRVCEEALAAGATTVHLEVEVDNDRALGLYTSVGFEPVVTEDYFELQSLR